MVSGRELPAGLGATLGGYCDGGEHDSWEGGKLLARAGGDWHTRVGLALLLGLGGGVPRNSDGRGQLVCGAGDWRAWSDKALLLGLGRVWLAELGGREGDGKLLASAGRVSGGHFSVTLLSLVLLVS